MKNNIPFNVLANKNSWENVPRDPITLFTFATGTLGYTTAGAILFSAAATLAITAVTSWAVRALTPIPDFGDTIKGQLVNSKTPTASLEFVYGEVRKGGVVTYTEATGSENKYLHQIIVLAGHEVEEIGDIYLNDQIVSIDSSNIVTSAPWGSKIRIQKFTGAPGQDFASSIAGLPSEAKPTVPDSFKGQNLAFLYVRHEYDQEVYANGIPLITAVVKGKKVFDPRTSDTSYSDNAALCIRDYLTSSYGLSDASVDATSFSSAANICDENVALADGTTEKRYKLNGIISASEPVGRVLEDMMTSCAGTLFWGGGKWRLKAGAYSTPVKTFTHKDLRSGLSIGTAVSVRDNFNIVRGVFRDADQDFISADYPEIKSSQFILDDNSEESVLDLALPFTTSSAMAQRLAKLTLYRNREQITVNADFGMEALEVEVGDIVQLTLDKYGWDQKAFEVLGWKFNSGSDKESLSISLALRETSSAAFDWNAEENEITSNNTNLPDFRNIGSISGVVGSNAGALAQDGTFLPKTRINWLNSASIGVTEYAVRYRKAFLTSQGLERKQHINFSSQPQSGVKTRFEDASENNNFLYNAQNLASGYSIQSGGPTGRFLQKNSDNQTRGLALIGHSKIQSELASNWAYTFWFRLDSLSSTANDARLIDRGIYGGIKFSTSNQRWTNSYTANSFSTPEGEWFFFCVARSGTRNTFRLFSQNGTKLVGNSRTRNYSTPIGVGLFGSSTSSLDFDPDASLYNTLSSNSGIVASVADIQLHSGAELTDEQLLRILEGEDGYSFKSRVVTTTEIELIEGDVGEQIEVGVQARNALGFRSPYTSDLFTVLGDTTAPDPVTDLAAIGGQETIRLSWNNPVASTTAPFKNTDIKAARIYRHSSDDRSSAGLLAISETNYFVDSGLPASQTYYYWVEPVDNSGNYSVSSTSVSATTEDTAPNETVWVIYADDEDGTNQSYTPVDGYDYIGFVRSVSQPALPVSTDFSLYVGEGQVGPQGGSVYPIYATNSSGAGQSFDQGAREYVAFYEAEEKPTLPLSPSETADLTWAKVVGEDGAQGASVYPIYATNSSGAGQSFDQGAREYVAFYEAEEKPTLPLSPSETADLTWAKVVGEDGAQGASVYPIYATNSSGAGQSFTQGTRQYVAFYEAATRPSLPLSPSETASLTWSRVVGEQGPQGPQGPKGDPGSAADNELLVNGRVYWNQLQTTKPNDPTATNWSLETGWFTDLSSGWQKAQPSVSITDTTKFEWSAAFEVTLKSTTSGYVVQDITFFASESAVQVTDTLESDNFVSGSSGWQIKRETGAAEFAAASIRGTLSVSNIPDLSGTYATETELNSKNTIYSFPLATPPQNPNTGDLWYVTDRDNFRRWSGSAWVDLAITADSIVSTYVYAGNISAGQIASGTIDAARIGAGTIDADKIATDAINSDKIAANAITAEHISANSIGVDKLSVLDNLSAITADLGDVNVNEVITLTGSTSGMIANKSSLAAYSEDGFFVGKTLQPDGSSGFEFTHTNVNSSSQISGIVHNTSSGFQIFNPIFRTGGSVSGGTATYTSTQTVNLGSGNSNITYTIIGGGGAGGYGLDDGSATGRTTSRDGSATQIRIRVGSSTGTIIHDVTAQGGHAGNNAISSRLQQTGLNGEGSSFGPGGSGGAHTQAGGNATNYGSGGGGGGGDYANYGLSRDAGGAGGQGGRAGEQVSATVDTSSYSSSTLYLQIVSVGTGGGVNTEGDYDGGSGANGVVQVSSLLSGLSTYTIDDLVADAEKTARIVAIFDTRKSSGLSGLQPGDTIYVTGYVSDGVQTAYFDWNGPASTTSFQMASSNRSNFWSTYNGNRRLLTVPNGATSASLSIGGSGSRYMGGWVVGSR